MNPSQTPREDELMWVIFGIFLLIFGSWFIGHTKISAFVMAVRSIETYLMIFDPEGKSVLRLWLSTARPENVTFDQIIASGTIAGRTIRWVEMVILTGMFGYLIYRAPDRGTKYTKKYTTDTLAAQESSLWPVIKPVLGANIIDIPLDDPINGMRQRPRDYGRRHGFIVPIAGLSKTQEMSDVDLLDHKDALIISKATAIFSTQLGILFPGIPNLKNYERSLFAAFAAQINNDNDLALKIIYDLSIAYLRAKKANDVTQINSLRAQTALFKYGNSKVVKQVTTRHAYTRTVLIAMLSAARGNGSLPANWFRWLKTTNRVTWYCMSDLGLDVASVEAGGVRAHWQAERMAKTAIANPMIEPAIVGLKTALEELVDVEEDD